MGRWGSREAQRSGVSERERTTGKVKGLRRMEGLRWRHSQAENPPPTVKGWRRRLLLRLLLVYKDVSACCGLYVDVCVCVTVYARVSPQEPVWLSSWTYKSDRHSLHGLFRASTDRWLVHSPTPTHALTETATTSGPLRTSHVLTLARSPEVTPERKPLFLNLIQELDDALGSPARHPPRVDREKEEEKNKNCARVWELTPTPDPPHVAGEVEECQTTVLPGQSF